MFYHRLVFLFLCYFSIQTFAQSNREIVVGSKMFSENYLISEILAQLLESRGVSVVRKHGLGGTLMAYKSLEHQQIDIYPDYTGTISKVILKNESLSTFSEIKAEVEKGDLTLLQPLGFSNSYGIAIQQDLADKFNISKISDLKNHPNLRVGFNFEFINREDGWPKLKEVYDLDFSDITTLEQALVFEAFSQDKLDLIVVYTTDGKILKYKMKVLEDDQNMFPLYEATFYAHKSVSPKALEIARELSGAIDEATMIELNARVDVEGKKYQQVATEFLVEKGFILEAESKETRAFQEAFSKILRLTLEHLYLVFVSTFAATLVGVPFGVLLFRHKKWTGPTLYFVGLLQTIPSLALLVYMIPLFGVSVKSALMALFLYSLLPIIQNTVTGLQSVSSQLVHAGEGIGLFKREILWSIELPLSAPVIVAGVRIAAVINVGTATIAAFIGSGGLGELIVQGLTLNDLVIMQQGAVPAAFLAIVVNLFFTFIEKKFTLN